MPPLTKAQKEHRKEHTPSSSDFTKLGRKIGTGRISRDARVAGGTVLKAMAMGVISRVGKSYPPGTVLGKSQALKVFARMKEDGLCYTKGSIDGGLSRYWNPRYVEHMVVMKERSIRRAEKKKQKDIEAAEKAMKDAVARGEAPSDTVVSALRGSRAAPKKRTAPVRKTRTRKVAPPEDEEQEEEAADEQEEEMEEEEEEE